MTTPRLLTALLLSVTIITFSADGKGNSDLANARETLLPFTESYDLELRPIFDQKLIRTPANYGRMIRMHGGSDVGDSVVSVHCGTGEDCQVTLTRAEQDLDLVTAGHRGDRDPFLPAKQVRVIRSDAPISRNIASIFRASLEKLLPEPGDRSVETVEGYGFDRIEFWLPGADKKSDKGEAQRRPKAKVKSLIQMGDLLSRYAEASSDHRRLLVARIKKEGERILGRR